MQTNRTHKQVAIDRELSNLKGRAASVAPMVKKHGAGVNVYARQTAEINQRADRLRIF